MNWTSGDQRAPLRELTKDICVEWCKYSEFTWLVPVMKPLFPDYRDLRDKYTDAVIGNSPSVVEEPKTEKHVRFKVRSRFLGDKGTGHETWCIQLWLLANKYTMAKRDALVDTFEFSILYRGDSYNMYNRFIEDKLKGILSQG